MWPSNHLYIRMYDILYIQHVYKTMYGMYKLCTCSVIAENGTNFPEV